METIGKKIIQFNRELEFKGELPNGIQVMNPFKENKEILTISESFYNKFYKDTNKRKMILGINPGRLGAGVTGIPFTDTKRLAEICDIEINSVSTHEPSSVFIYEVIKKFGGAKKFYGDYYINSMSPLGFIEKSAKGNWINRNYYDYSELFKATEDFIISSLKKQLDFGIDTTNCIVLGKKNAKFVKQINDKERLFNKLTILDHPRFIVQYKSKEKDAYLAGYLEKLIEAFEF